MKQGNTLKKMLSLFMASAVALSLFGCKKDSEQTVPENEEKQEQKQEQQNQTPDDMVSIWLPISKAEYNADGSKGSRQYTYTYTDKGLPLTMVYDWGGMSQVWNEAIGIFEYTYFPFDGTVDSITEYFYNDRSDILYATTTRNTYEDGELVDTNIEYLGRQNLVAYHYDSNGSIESVDWHSTPVGSNVASDNVISVSHYCYDKGNLVEIYTENLTNGNTSWQNDFRYDAQGRLSASTIRPKEGCIQYQYKYDNQGRFIEASLLRAPCQTPLDDSHISQSSSAYPQGAFSLDSKAIFTYDQNGNLISRQCLNASGEVYKSTECTYDNSGNLATVIYKWQEYDHATDTTIDKEAKYVYVDDEKNADSSATTFVRDQHGNIVKVIFSDGDYVVYKYQEFRMSAKDATKCKNIHMANSRISPFGNTNSHFKFCEGNGYVGYMPMVETPLFLSDVMHNKIN